MSTIIILRKDQLQTNVKTIDNSDAIFYKENDGQGRPIYESASLRMAMRRAVANTYTDEQNLTGDQKLERYMLATKIWKADDLELTPQELTTVKECVAKAYSIEVVGYIYGMLTKNSMNEFAVN